MIVHLGILIFTFFRLGREITRTVINCVMISLSLSPKKALLPDVFSTSLQSDYAYIKRPVQIRYEGV